ncbi:mechanosensitive ion channel [Candidatus Peregrinibacteria bacterium]|nr:MAG: mechanosensitive ion channel [Candidatus Peregrinibacteria bacterium]
MENLLNGFILDYGELSLRVLIILLLTLLGLRTVQRYGASYYKISRFAVLALGLVFVLSNLGFNVSSLLTGLGIGGVAVALAAQETLSNAFAYFSILADKPFRVGDTISCDKYTGEVLSMGLRSVRLRSKEKAMVVIPNKTVASLPIENLSR